MQSRLPSRPGVTRQRLLEAAARIFARDGLAGATTRVIAQDAGVNEVTLFRHFQSKERLIAAVVGQNFGPQARAVPIPTPTANLESDLHALGRGYESLLQENWPLVRTMLGEMHNHLTESHEKQVFRAIFLPLKEAVVARVETAQRDGALRRDRRADLLSDLFLGSIFTGVLRRSMPHLKIAYSATAYLEAAVEQFLDGARVGKT
jgi:AcrR family transcriptional regulator